jgi:transposase InsO family protein
MSRSGNCWDNSAMESFFKSLKVERTDNYAGLKIPKIDVSQNG